MSKVKRAKNKINFSWLKLLKVTNQRSYNRFKEEFRFGKSCLTTVVYKFPLVMYVATHHDCGNLPDLILFERNSNFYPYHRKHQDNLIVFVEISKVLVRKQNPCINLNWKFLFSHIRHHGEHYKQKHVITSIFDLLQIKVRLLLHRSWTS